MQPFDVSSFLQKFAADNHSEAEHLVFIEWLKTAPVADVENALDQYYTIINTGKMPAAAPGSAILSKIEATIDQYELGAPKKYARVHRMGWKQITGIAAALLILFAAASIIWLIARQKNTPVNTTFVKPSSGPVPNNELLPGGNKATLTLGNGAVIALDDAKNGTIAKQGNTLVHKAASGQLIYNAQKNAAPEMVYNTLTTPRGGQFRLTLPDGSEVWLNAAASIKYPTIFAGNQRKVEITGEAYFEIAHDATKPFIVSVRGMEVKVLGTHFNINAYSDEAALTTSLLQGSISLNRGGDSVLLQPGQQAKLAGSSKIKIVNDADMEEVVAWKNGYFSFNRADIQTVMRQIARWYDVTISYEGAIPDRSFGGKIDRNSNASDVLKILEESKVHFSIEGKKIIVHP